MAIAAKRFEVLDNETNVGVADFSTGGNSGPLNIVTNEVNSITSQVDKFLGTATKTYTDYTVVAEETVNDAIRSSSDALSNIIDTSDLLPKEITEAFKDIIPGDNIAMSLLNALAPECKNKTLSRNFSGKPFDASLSCNGDTRASSGECSTEGFGNVIARVSGGAFDFEFTNDNNLLNRLISLSTMGYDLNMCGVFSSLSGGIGANLLNKASANILGNLTSGGDVLGMLDMASASIALNPSAILPSIGLDGLTNLSIPDSIPEIGLSSLTDRVEGSMEIFDGPGWNHSPVDNILSSQGIINDGLSNMYEASAMDNIFEVNDLNVAPVDDHTFLSAVF